MERLQEQGRSCYKRKDYTRALAFFDRALTRGQSVHLYDNRAACHEKLNDLPSALGDAKKAIKQSREDPTGYLRAGRVLVNMEKKSVALEILSHGLKCVKHVGQGYELLRDAHKRLSDELHPVENVDPLTILPRELAEQILNYLSFKQKMNVCMVSRSWVSFIRSMPGLWHHLDYSDAKKKVKNAVISRAINCGRKQIKRATLTNLFDFDKALRALVEHTALEDLTILDAGLQGANAVEILAGARNLKRIHFGQQTEVSQDTLRQLVETSGPLLECLSCDDVRVKSLSGIDFQNLSAPKTSFTTFSITCGVMKLGRAFFGHLPAAMPNLRVLNIFETHHKVAGFDPFGLVDLRALTSLQKLSLHTSSVGMSHNLKLPPSLQYFRLCSGRRLAGGFFVNVAPIGGVTSYRLPKLLDLDVDIFVDSFADVANFLSDFGTWDNTSPSTSDDVLPLSKLTRLSLNWYHNDPTASGLDQLLSHPRLADLKQIGLHLLGADNAAKIDVILAKLPALEQVDFSGTQLSGVEIKKLVKSGHVRQIVINDCPDVSRDAVEYARGQGVEVQWRVGKKAYDDGARKVRY